MNKFWFILVLTLTMFARGEKLYAQSPSTQGTEFWVTFMKNFTNTTSDITDQLSLMISAKKSCSGTISNPNTGWSVPFTIPAGGLVKITVNPNHCYNENSDIVENRGLYVTSTDTISLFASNYENRSFDIANVLPVSTLADEYIVQMYSSSSHGGEFVIIANEDGTEVEITPTAATKGGKPANVPFTLILNRGETYQLITADSTGEFSGTYVKSKDCKKIAIFNGNVSTRIPNAYDAVDHIIEQAVPVIYWGKEFAITATDLRSKDRIRITAAEDGTQIKRNGTILTTINAREYYEMELTAEQGSCFVETSNPAAVYLYLVGYDYGGSGVLQQGDPSMVWISPIEQKIREITFGTYQTNEILAHFVNIVVATADKNTVTLDGQNIGSHFTPLAGNPALSFARRSIAHKAHTLKSNKGIIAHVYGLGYRESYAYSVGSAMADLQRTIWINDERYSMDLFVPKYFCVNTPIKIHLEINYPFTDVFWSFGDGQTQSGTDTTVYHQYDNAGTYEIKAIIQRVTVDECTGQMFDTISAIIKLTDYHPITEFYDTLCPGTSYSNYGFSLTVVADTILTDTIPTEVCDSFVFVHLSVYPAYNDTIPDTICLGETYDKYNFTQTPGAAGTFYYRKNLHTVHGCDSIVTLKLIVYSSYNSTIKDTICLGDTYNEHGFNETPTSTGIKNYTQSHAIGNNCDSIINLELTVFPVYNDTLEFVVCANDSANFPYVGTNVTTPHTSIHGCDSIVTYYYVLSPTHYDTIQDTICITDTYNDNGFNITPDTTGTFSETLNLLSQKGCDSIVTLNLIVLPIFRDTVEVTLCAGDNYNDHGIDITPQEEGDTIYNQILTAANGCDSIITILITVNPSYTDTIKVIHDSVSGSGYTADTTIIDVTVNGCDSTTFIHVRIPGYDGDACSIDTVHSDACVFKRFHEGGFDTIPTAVGLIVFTKTFTDHSGCDSIVTLFLDVWQAYDTIVKIPVCSDVDSLPHGTIISQTIQNLTSEHGCDSIVTLQYLHYLIYRDTIRDTICLANTYNEHGFNVTPTTAGLNYYTDTATTVNFCDSIILLELEVAVSHHDTIPREICLGETYNEDPFYNKSPATAGIHYFSETYILNNGCDSVVTLKLKVNPVYDTIIQATICIGDTYSLNNFNITPADTGVITDIKNLTTGKGCDSIVTLMLTTCPVYSDTIYDTICLGKIYHKHGFFEIPMTAGTANYTINPLSKSGCDSIINLILLVNPIYDYIIYDTVCINERYTEYGFDTISAIPGLIIDSHHDTTAYGCDSIVTLRLSVGDIYSVIFNDTTCQGERYHEHNFDVVPLTSGDLTYTQEKTSIFGCDSIITLNLFAYPSYHDSIEIPICIDETQEQDPPIEFDYTYTQTFETINGCDSSITILYNFYPSFYDTIRAEICLGDTYYDDESHFNETPTSTGLKHYIQKLKTRKGCDSIINLELTVHPVYDIMFESEICLGDRYYQYNFDTIPPDVGFISYSQNLTTKNNCDSIITLNLTVNPVYKYSVEGVICSNETYNQYGFHINPADTGFFTYVQDLTTLQKGCDSIITLYLTVNKAYEVYRTDTIYEDEFSYIGDNKFNTPGWHSVSYLTPLDCDSIVNLDLYVIYYPSEFTAFSPYKRDGQNDYFMPGFKVQIFNRYGTLIYETRTPEQQALGWDGRNNNGHMVDPGMFFYILYNSSGKPRIKSTVEVLKR